MQIDDPGLDRVEDTENLFIPMLDGVCLAARLWRPMGSEVVPVPAILEYIPYGKRFGTAARDETMHPWMAAQGYARVRVDLRDSGESDGVLEDEYLQQELGDGAAVIDWLAAQPWCDGNAGMIGVSWVGSNGLQIAAMRPPALKAVTSVCSTDDRYADDVHRMGGCLLGDNLSSASVMFSYNSMPPDTALVGERWREIWRERLDSSGLWLAKWLVDQRRDAYWRHGSIYQDFDAVETPVDAISGWADGYSNAVFRLVAGLRRAPRGTGPRARPAARGRRRAGVRDRASRGDGRDPWRRGGRARDRRGPARRAARAPPLRLAPGRRRDPRHLRPPEPHPPRVPERPKPMRQGERTMVCVKLNDVAYRFPAGHRMRLSISTSYWPLACPSPETARVTLIAGESHFVVPVRPPRGADAKLVPFGPPRGAPPLPQRVLTAGEHDWRVVHDLGEDRQSREMTNDSGRTLLEDLNPEVTSRAVDRYGSVGDDVRTARAETVWERELARGDWRIRTFTRTVLTADAEGFRAVASLDAFEENVRIYGRDWDERIQRDSV